METGLARNFVGLSGINTEIILGDIADPWDRSVCNNYLQTGSSCQVSGRLNRNGGPLLTETQILRIVRKYKLPVRNQGRPSKVEILTGEYAHFLDAVSSGRTERSYLAGMTGVSLRTVDRALRIHRQQIKI